ncbi:MAG: formimidoylglutamase [bacterium]|nr:MAG: formimidoylglutamase [bacterium]
MNERYTGGNFNWIGRVDGIRKEQLRWHQVIRNIDLDKDKISAKGFCIIGFESDIGIEKNKGRIGAKEAPDTIRRHLSSLPWYFDNINLYDAGNVVCKDSLENAQELLSNKVKDIFDAGLLPIIIGGGHETAFGSVIGFYKHFKDMPSIINFDAHFDMRDYKDGATSGTSFKQIGDICREVNKNFRYCCIGIQKSSNTQELFNRAANYGAKWIDTEMIRFNEKAALKKLDVFLNASDNIHLTICRDVFAQNAVFGVSAPQPFGLTTNEFLKFFYFVLKSGKVKSFDIAEVSPPLDVGDAASILTAHIIFRLTDKTAQGLVSLIKPEK